MVRTLVKGNEAAVLGALMAGCDAYFGYPITPASEIAHAASEYFPQLGKAFLQAESEIGAVNMAFGASSAGMRVMTASSGPGISLKMEGVSYLAGAQLPCVIVDIMRAGPGLGNIGPEQADYFQVVKGGGHGSYHCIVLAPNSVKEMYELTMKAFELADLYRTPVFVLADAVLGQMMEPVEIRERVSLTYAKPWRVDATPETSENLITSIYLDFDDMEEYIRRLEAKYRTIEQREAMAEVYKAADAEVILTGYGIVSRLLHSAVDACRNEGLKVGMIRPRTLWPFPVQVFKEYAEAGRRFLAVELSTGQYVEDVRLALPGAAVELFTRVGGNLPTQEEIRAEVRRLLES